MTCWAGVHSIMLGLPPGTPIGFGNVGEFVRDARGSSPDGDRYRRDVRPPKDAISTGITNGYATIWTSEKLGDEWLIVQVGDRFERWPATVAACPAN